MDFAIHILKGVNDIEFGMTRGQVRRRMTGTYKLADNKDGHYRADLFEEYGVFFRYGDDGHLDACEFFGSARTWLGGVNVMALTVGQAVEVLTRLDPTTEVEVDGATAYDAVLAIWTLDPDEEGPAAPLESFLVGRPGYYDSLRPEVRDDRI